jgi:predicted regulator of Ras-like GTPase activity (Roadblock/LC7/MglB family)
MIFDEVVEKAVVETNGAIASIIMASDGISLSQYLKPEVELDLETLGIEYANLLMEINRSSEAMQAGSLNELALSTEKYLTLIRMINKEYFHALIMNPDGNHGKGRFLLRVNAPKLLEEL